MSVSSSVVHKYMRVRSIRDLDYELHAHNFYHPAFHTASLMRLQSLYPSLGDLLKHMLRSESSVRVWAIVIESQRSPALVLRNLLHTRTTLAFRRVLHIRLEDVVSSGLLSWDVILMGAAALLTAVTHTCVQDNTAQINVGEFPLTLVR